MKKLFTFLALAIGLVSCQTEPEGFDVNVGGEQDVNITVSLPESTRAASNQGFDFTNFENNSDYDLRFILEISYNGKVVREVKTTETTSATFPVRLAPEKEYTFTVWADLVNENSQDDLYYNILTNAQNGVSALSNITFKEWTPNVEARDAYTLSKKITFNAAADLSMELKRPFAKVRVVATDIVDIRKFDLEPDNATVSYAAGMYESFNAVEGTAGAATTTAKAIDYDIVKEAYSADAAAGQLTVFADYILVPASGTVQFSLDIKDGAETIKLNNFNTAIPVVENQVTSIVGDVLTMGDNISIEVKPEFGGQNQWPDEDNDAEQLAYAAMFGGEVTLTADVVLTQPLEIVEGANVVINLDGKTITGDWHKDNGAIIKNNGTLTIVGGTISSTGENGGSAIQNKGTLTVNDATLNGAPNANGSWPSYSVNNTGIMTVENTTITSYHGAVASYGDGAVVTLNNCTIDMAGIAGFTSHGIYTYNNGKVVVNGGTYENKATDQASSGASVINGAVEVNAGTFSGRIENYYGTPVIKGGAFSVKPNNNFIATGYKAIVADGIYYVLSETIANAAVAEGVTAVTESTADVATALATDNGEATLFMWNDVAYIAKYGEVVITSDADEATTVRGVVENSAGLTSATVADGIEVVGNRTFRKCANLETVALPNTLTEIGPAVFQSCSKLANITIPESVTTIGEGAFAECKALTSINIPAGITRLEKDVLRNTGLVSVEIPASVNYIGTYAFRDCESLTEIKILSPEFTIENNTFTNMAAPVPTMTIHVVNAEMKAYLDSILTAYDKSYITVVGPTTVSNADELKAAIINGGNIEFANDITVDEWIMFSEDYNIGTGNIITIDEIDVTIDGKGHTLTVNSIESAGNGDQLFQGASVLNISNLTLKYADGLTTGGLGMHSGVIKNVHFVGGGSSAASAAIFPKSGEIKVEDCIFDTNGVAFYFDDECDNLTVTRCTFNQKDNKNVILLRGDVKFSDNIINSGRTVNVVSGSPVVTGNNFNNVRFKVYGAATATISNNIINNLEFDGATYSSTFTNNTLSSAAQAALNAATKVN